MDWIKNHWYAAALSPEVGRHLLSRTFFDEKLVLYRKEDGHAAILRDRCPHKGAPLSLGVLSGDVVACPYHGLQFDCTGKCVRIPSQDAIPPTAKVQSYPCVERYGIIWFWPGDPSLADEKQLFEFRNFDDPNWETFQGPYTHFPAAIGNILDNLVDPAHTTFVHQGTIGGVDASDVPLKVEENEKSLVVGRWIEQSEPVPVMRKYGDFASLVDRWQYYHLFLPNISLVDMGAVDVGSPHDEASRNSKYRTLSYAVLTPETAHTTHYFWFVMRCFAIGDEQVSSDMRQAYIRTFDEDRALLGAIQSNCDDMLASPLRLAIDNASIRLRRRLNRMIEVDNGLPSNPAATIHPETGANSA
jgi:vanillate O-demethylase monooxygenase subunit